MKRWRSGFTLAPALLAGVLACHPSDPASSSAQALDRLRRGLAAGTTTIDLYGDGKVKLTRTLAGGLVTRSKLSLSGRTIQLIEREPSGHVRVSLSLSASGKVDRLIDRTPAAIAGTFDVVVTRFAARPAEPDVRESYLDDPSQPTFGITREEDPSHDGSWVGVASLEEPRESLDLTIPSGTASNCTAAQASALRAAFDDAVVKGSDCLSGLGQSELAAALLETAASEPFEVYCAGGSTTNCGRFTDNPNGVGGSIGVFDPGFTDPSCNGVAATIFHELLHDDSLLGRHTGDQLNDPNDRIVACSKTCFGQGNSLTCAACLQVQNGDPRCVQYPPRPCPGFYCTCLQHYYDKEADCVAVCNGLNCAFGNVCGPPTDCLCSR